MTAENATCRVARQYRHTAAYNVTIQKCEEQVVILAILVTNARTR